MSRDFKLDEYLQTYWNDVGDIEDVRGLDQIEQSIVISIVENVALESPGFTPGDIEELRGDIEAAVSANPQSRPPIQVEVDEIDYEAKEISYLVQTSRVALPITAE